MAVSFLDFELDLVVVVSYAVIRLTPLLGGCFESRLFQDRFDQACRLDIFDVNCLAFHRSCSILDGKLRNGSEQNSGQSWSLSSEFPVEVQRPVGVRHTQSSPASLLR